MPLTKRSLDRLKGLHPDLVRVVIRADSIGALDFQVGEGLRDATRQRALFAAGATTTMNSRHIADARGVGHAVDLVVLVAGRVRWDWPLYHRLGALMQHAAEELHIPIEWGGNWKTFKDGPHFQLPWAVYPASKEKAA